MILELIPLDNCCFRQPPFIPHHLHYSAHIMHQGNDTISQSKGIWLMHPLDTDPVISDLIKE
jgi:hypothetical protein